ncbi:MAG: hypothetical protein E7321_06285 [Clostridiales bacterium]|nr:hypothetical protein [Clostridiales bacterium]
MIRLIHKYATPLALLSALAALFAAPYLIPENPDSEIFRSGLLGTLLVLACCFPLEQAFRKANLRTLVCGAAFGLMLGFSLSLGAELRFYNGLLPGMGSLIRRFAVPVMVTPLLGGLAARIMLMRKDSDQPGKCHFPLPAYFLLFMLCWLPLLIAFYPGMLNYDFNTEYRQWFYHEWDDRHPLLYIALCYGVFSIGRLLNQPELAIFAVTVIRMAAFAAALAYCCVFVQRRRAPAWALALMTAAFAFLPVFSVMSVSAAKDTPFASALLVLSLLCWEAIEDPKAFFASRRRCAAFVLMVVFTYHMRKNGVAALVLLPLLVLTVRGFRKKAAILCAASLAVTLLVNAGIYTAFKPFAQPSFQTYSIPAQQLVRAYNVGDMTEAEKEELRSWYVDDNWGLRLYPHLADAAKGYLNQEMLSSNADAFMDLWARVGRKNLRVYAEAFLMLNVGAWYPDDLSHSTVYRDTSGLLKGYLQTDEYDFSEYGVKSFNPLPKVKQFVNKICRLNEYQKYPLLTLLLCTATPLWVILFACCMLVARRKGRYVVCASGVLALWLSYMFGPCTLARYMLPLFCLAPALLILAFSTPDQDRA